MNTSPGVMWMDVIAASPQAGKPKWSGSLGITTVRQSGQSHGRVAPGSVLRKGAGSRVAQEGLSMLCEIEHNMDYAELLIMRNESAEAFCRVDSGSVNSA